MDIKAALARLCKHGLQTAYRAGASCVARLARMARIGFGTTFENHYEIECHDSSGALKWVEHTTNTVVNAGLDDLLDKYFKGSAYTAQHYVGLISGPAAPTIAAADTMASHVGWTLYTNYSEATRDDMTADLGAVSGQSLTNSGGNQAKFTINGAGGDVAGAFVTDTVTKGGATGLLYGAAAFTNRAVIAGDTITVSVTLTAATA